MALESATYITGLVSTNPTASDQKRYGDDHIRMVKSVLLTTFPNLSAAVTVTPTEINYLAGATSAIQTQIAATQASITLRALNASPTLTGVPAAPTPATGTNSTQIATTAFVTAAIAGAGALGGVSSVNPGANLVPLASADGAINSSWSPAGAMYAYSNFGGF